MCRWFSVSRVIVEQFKGIVDKDRLTINLKLFPNPELLQLLLSYSGNVKVLAPVSLKDKYKEEIRKGMEICG